MSIKIRNIRFLSCDVKIPIFCFFLGAKLKSNVLPCNFSHAYKNSKKKLKKIISFTLKQSNQFFDDWNPVCYFRLDQAANISARGQTLQALMTLQNLLEQDKAVFRYLPTESMTLASMFKEEFKEEGTLYHTRITLEVKRSPARFRS